MLTANIAWAQPAAFGGAKRILFLGNSITYAGSYITDIEACIKARYPQSHFEFINMGLPSETVSQLSEEGHAGGRFPRPALQERINRVLQLVQPQLVFICYGMNDGIYLPFDSARFRPFAEGLTQMHNQVVATGAAIIHLTPPFYDDRTGSAKGYQATLDRYSQWVMQQQKTAGWQVIDIHDTMKQYTLQQRQRDSSFSLAADGVHPGEQGHWLMAKTVLEALGENWVSAFADVHSALQQWPHGAAIFTLVTQRQTIMKDAWLTAAKHTRPEMNTGMPLTEALLQYEQYENKLNALQAQ